MRALDAVGYKFHVCYTSSPIWSRTRRAFAITGASTILPSTVNTPAPGLLRRPHGFHHPPGMGDLLLIRGVEPVDDGDLAGVDARLAAEAQRPGIADLRLKPLLVVQRAPHSVDGR